MNNSVPARPGDSVTIKGRTIPFSYYPVTRSTRRYGLQSKIFATNPWGIIRQSIEDGISTKVPKVQALSFLEQAENFYFSAKSSFVIAAKPLLFYYSFLNIAKALCLKNRTRTSYDRAWHGLQEGVKDGGKEFIDSYVRATKSTSTKAYIFDDLRKALKRPPMAPAGREYQLAHIAPQLLQGHRVWCEAANEQERFVEIHDMRFVLNEPAKEVWLTIDFISGDLTRFSIPHKTLLAESGLSGKFRRVVCDETYHGDRILRFEQSMAMKYSGRASDKIRAVADYVRPYIWTSATMVHPYRKYYLYLCPKCEHDSMLPQILSIYAYFYYLGSVTRYKPYHFDEMLSGRYGGHIQEIIADLPQQFLYLLASEFSDREIVHAPTMPQ